MFVSITRLRIRAWWYMLPFVLANEKTVKQIKSSSGFREGVEAPDGFFTFWTMTLWESEAAMKAYRGSGAHKDVMPKLAKWCDEAAVTHWEADALPTWAEAHRRLVEKGRTSRVDNPSANHPDRRYAAPRTGGGRPLKPA